MPAKEWRNLLVVLVVDELGNRPELLRTLIAVATNVEREVCSESGESSGDMQFGAFKLICVGTGLDWAACHCK